MPLVFVTDAPTLWDSSYADIVGVQYEFPTQYRDYVRPGERFLYYRGARGTGRGGTGYFGNGVVGELRDSSKPGHLIVQVDDVALYEDVLSIRDPAGNYWETGSTAGTNWANGVRRVSDAVFDGITVAARPVADVVDSSVGFADPGHASAMERYSVRVALDELRREFPGVVVREMPVNNPGYDIEVALDPVPLHVEVKGTVLPAPVFHLSEGQRQHAELLGGAFRLMVVYSINVGAKRHKTLSCEGPLDASRVQLQPSSWTGLLRSGAVVE